MGEAGSCGCTTESDECWIFFLFLFYIYVEGKGEGWMEGAES